MTTHEAAPRQRLRELGVEIGRFEPGPWNAITDVAGVRVGHCSVLDGSARTGVTAILPNNDDIFARRLLGGAFILNGAGEMSGLIQLQEWGLLETPILLTNTLAVGKASSALVEHMVRRHPHIGSEHDVIIPLVGECDDSFVNDIAGQHVKREHVYEALDGARSGPVEEGNVGGGTGMVSFDLKGGIGTSSRLVPIGKQGDTDMYTLGVLVMSNVGRLEDLRIDGLQVSDEIEELIPDLVRRKSLYGSIIAVLATDAPLTSYQIQRLCKRVALGIGRVGSFAAHGSGEIVIGFSTANEVARSFTGGKFSNLKVLHDFYVDPLYQAALECTEEAILNALCMATSMQSARGELISAIPLDVVRLVGDFKAYRASQRFTGK